MIALQRQKIMGIFDKMDADHSGDLDFEEFEEVMMVRTPLRHRVTARERARCEREGGGGGGRENKRKENKK